MGQKSNPIGLRLQINRTWDSRGMQKAGVWRMLLEDIISASSSSKRCLSRNFEVVIERPARISRSITQHVRRITARGCDIEKLKS